MRTKELQTLTDFMCISELVNDSFIANDSWQTLMDISEHVLYYEQTYALDESTIQKDGKCVFENITEALLELDRKKYGQAILKAIKWLNKKRK